MHGKEKRKDRVATLHWFYRFRSYLIIPPLIFALFCFRHETEAEFIWPLGICLFFCGLVLRVWAQEHLHYRLNVHKHLTVTGPYSFFRNPIYVGNILICLGGIVVSELLWLIPITFLYCFGIYSLVIRYEESHLLDKYGELYRQYMVEAPRWFPKVRCLKDIGLINKYFRQSIVAEVHCLLLLLPYMLKDILDLSTKKLS
jgi:protein-S-isoprenylcysteine O-methyltransferase Ste14